MFWILKQITALNFINFKFTPKPNLKLAKLPYHSHNQSLNKIELHYLLFSQANQIHQHTIVGCLEYDRISVKLYTVSKIHCSSWLKI